MSKLAKDCMRLSWVTVYTLKFVLLCAVKYKLFDLSLTTAMG